MHGTLRRKQRRLARENTGVLEAIRKGANLAIQECQYQFRNRWWNCSTKNFLRGKNLFGKIVDRGKSHACVSLTHISVCFVCFCYTGEEKNGLGVVFEDVWLHLHLFDGC